MSRYELDGETSELRFLGRSVEVDGRVHRFEVLREEKDGRFEITLDGQRLSGWRVADGDKVHLWIDGRAYTVTRLDPLSGAAGAGAGGDDIRADMPGRVVSVDCAVGDQVGAGQTLLTAESMKLQVAIVAPRDGRVAAVCVSAEASFDKGAVLVSLEPLETAEPEAP